MLRDVNLDAVTAIMTETAAEEIVPRFRALAAHEIEEKSPGELVTVVDERAERRLAERLRELLPGSQVVGEEAVARDPGELARLAEPDPVWIVDPLDGTSNFANGTPAFAVIVALVRDGVTVAGWIHNPNDGTTAVTERGSGAFLDGQRMAVSRRTELGTMRAILTEGYFKGAARDAVRRLKAALADVTPFTCAGLAYLDLCTGAAEIAAPARLRPWDHAAGALMHGEAGGHNAMADGGAYSPLVDRGLFIVAPDAASWAAVRAILSAAARSAT